MENFYKITADIQEVLKPKGLCLVNLKLEVYSGCLNMDNLINIKKMDENEVITIYRADVYIKKSFKKRHLTFENLKGDVYSKIFSINFTDIKDFKENLSKSINRLIELLERVAQECEEDKETKELIDFLESSLNN